MSKNIRTVSLLVVLCVTGFSALRSYAEESPSGKTPISHQTKWEHYNQYARWSVGVNIGLPFFGGNFQSNAYDKLYWGIMAGLQGAYQFTPIVGVRANLDYAQGKTGAKSFEQDYWLDKYGFTDFRVTPLEGSMKYKDLYSKVRVINFSLHTDINVNNLIRPVPCGERRWTVSLSPGIYFQKFYPDVFTKEGDHHFAKEHFNPLSVSLGGESMLRWKAGRAIDLQARYGINWIHQNVFDGIATYRPRDKQNFMTHFSVGVVWKIGARHKKKDHLMYAPRYVAPPKERGRIVDTVIVKMEPQVIVQQHTVEIPVEKAVWYNMPTIHFKRGSATIETEAYADELNTIVKLLNEVPDATIRIYGYADHTGTERFNENLTQQRAEAMRDYLIGKGIKADRIRAVRGQGIDKSLSGGDAYSIKARRVEIVR